MKKSRISAAGIPVIAALALGILGSPVSAKSTISFWHNWSGAGGKVMQGLADNYMKTHKDVDIKVSQIGDAYQKLLVTTAAGNPPDVVVLDRYLTNNYAFRGILLKLDPYMQSSGMKGSSFYKSAMEEATYKGGIYSIPMTVDSRTLWYNKQLFQKAGLDPNKTPVTWDEMRMYAEKLTLRDSAGKITQLGFGPYADQGGVLIQWLWQNGADVFNKDQTKVTFNSAEAISALKWGLDLEDYYGKGYPFAGTGGLYKSKTAMDLNGPWEESNLIKNGPKNFLETMGFGPVPYFKKPAVLCGGMGLVVPALSKRKKEAWDFVRFITSQDQQIYFGTNNGTIPALISAARSKEYMKDPFRVAHVNEMDVTKARPAHPAYPDVEALMSAGFGQAQSKKKGLEQAFSEQIRAAQTVLDTALRRMKR